MSWKTIWVSVMACCCILAWAAGSGAESHKRRVDLTGRQDLTAEEIIAGLTPVRTRGIQTRGLQPGLATIALTVNFAFDSAEIQSQAIPNLESLGKALQSPQLAPYQIRIEGHTDSVGTAAYNRDLSQRRAESVKQYLTQHFDITPDHLVTAGKGEEEPISDNDSDTGRYKNRRAEFVNLGRR
jgi:OmpA-OmpF porin, OOP family